MLNAEYRRTGEYQKTTFYCDNCGKIYHGMKHTTQAELHCYHCEEKGER